MADWFDGNGNGSAVDVAEFMATKNLLQALSEVVGAGALLSMGLTSDGGAVSVTVTVDGRWRREYFRSGPDALAWLAEALPAIHEARNRPPASSAQRGRSRRG